MDREIDVAIKLLRETYKLDGMAEALGKFVMRADRESRRLSKALAVVEGARDVLAVRGKDFERSPLPAYMERPFSTLGQLITAYDTEGM